MRHCSWGVAINEDGDYGDLLAFPCVHFSHHGMAIFLNLPMVFLLPVLGGGMMFCLLLPCYFLHMPGPFFRISIPF